MVSAVEAGWLWDHEARTMNHEAQTMNHEAQTMNHEAKP